MDRADRQTYCEGGRHVERDDGGDLKGLAIHGRERHGDGKRKRTRGFVRTGLGWPVGEVGKCDQI